MSKSTLHLMEPILETMEDLYFHDERPWIIGYSGGKDSTLVCQLVFKFIQRLPEGKRTKQVYVVSSDTMVENPIIIDYLRTMSKEMGLSAKRQRLNISTHMVYPRIDNTFWTLLVGLGYPTPEPPGFRWCTERLKIDPSNKFIKDTIKDNGEVIILLGVRKGESTARAQRIGKRKIDGLLLNRHEVINGAYVYNPIVDLSTDEVWNILLDEGGVSPWGTNNKYLFSLYKSSDGGECPFTISSKEDGKDVPSCGNSRFGCWCCTMVKEDKSLKAFIESGESWLEPLLNFRSWLMSNRDNPSFRDTKRRNGTVYKRSDGSFGFGPFTLQARQIILEKLLETEKVVNARVDSESVIQLITMDELRKIDEMWDNEGDLTRRMLVDTYKKVYNKELPWDKYKKPLFDQRVLSLLEERFTVGESINEDNIPHELIKKLIVNVNQCKHYTHRPALTQNIFRTLNESWLHYNEMTKGLRNEDQ
ncbi:DNA phosphorothioation system sulfurtransferase DndC [Heliobacterium gestii]|uniref:DNA phosphorothioation system sulfurtransferase DndC n=1 Tax=Heliomicrobium gestii TaxID=2699 RepID=A0A845L5M0_HELGE|nr:DNA phosphorothioation system sulfurtransferase DndC [Heliomicrobium gestii]MBM7865678.1 DNA sulfur modification protein DndC [Heliomicrobium gestii]MZP41927.1 DNA phosphorothioation system sulfurtransferase DndC [Heliomicrobium gestii]